MRKLVLAVVIANAFSFSAALPAFAQQRNGQQSRNGGGRSTYVATPNHAALGGGYAVRGLPGYNYSGFNYSSVGYPRGLNYYYGPVGYGPVGPITYSAYGTPNFGPAYTYIPAAPVIVQVPPGFDGGPPFNNPVIQEWMPGDRIQQLKQQLAQLNEQPQQVVEPVIRPSNVEGKRRSIRLQAQGDEWFAKQNYLQAYAHYKQAASAAGDRGEPHFRMAFALAAMGHPDLAAPELKRGLRIEPNWAKSEERLDDIFGEKNELAKGSMLHKIAAWVKEDIRNPDRLFVMGVLLYFNDDADQALPFLQSADMIAGSPDYTQRFLKSPALDGKDALQAAKAGGKPQQQRAKVTEVPRTPESAPAPDPDQP